MVALTQGFMAFIGLVDGVLDEMRSRGILLPNLKPHAVRSALIGMLEGMLRDRFLAERLGFPADFSQEQLREMLGIVLRAFMVNQGSARAGQ